MRCVRACMCVCVWSDLLRLHKNWQAWTPLIRHRYTGRACAGTVLQPTVEVECPARLTGEPADSSGHRLATGTWKPSRKARRARAVHPQLYAEWWRSELHSVQVHVLLVRIDLILSNVSVCLSVCLSLSVSVCVCLSVCPLSICLSVSLSVSVCLSVCPLSVCLCLSLSLSVCPSLSFSLSLADRMLLALIFCFCLSLYLSLSVSLSLYLSLSPCLPVCLCPYLSLSVSVSVCLSLADKVLIALIFYLCLSPSLSLSPSPSLSVCLSVCLCISLSLLRWQNVNRQDI